MKGIILAAGKGVRARPLTLEIPKPLIKIKGKTLLERLTEKLPSEIDELVIVTGYLAEQIESFVGNEFLGRKTICVRQPEQRGTFDALCRCEPLIDNERFAVFFPDDLLGHQAIAECLKYDLAAAVKETTNPEKFGIVLVDENGFIADAVEKPKDPFSDLALASGYVLDPDIFRFPPRLGANDEYHLSEAIAGLSKSRKVKAVKSDFWFPISSAEDILRAEEVLEE